MQSAGYRSFCDRRKTYVVECSQEHSRDKIMGKPWGPVADEIPNFVRDLVTATGQSEREFIFGGEPQSLTGGLVQSGYRNGCRIWARDPSAYSQEFGNLQAERCEPYLKSIGEWPGDETTSQPFVGGQCAISYTVTVRYSDVFLGNPRVFEAVREVFGPITGLGAFSESNNELSILSPNGNVLTGLANVPFPCQLNPDDFSDCVAEIISVVPPPGVPDDCGDPPPNPVPRPGRPDLPPPGPIPPGPPADDPGDPSPFPSIEVPVDVTINPSGEITVCVGDACGAIPVDPAGGDGGGGNPKPTVGSGEDGESGGGDNDFGEPPVGEEWIGVFVELTAVPDEYGNIPGTAPQTVYPAPMGNASLYGAGRRYTAERLLSRWSGHFVEVARLPVEGVRVNVRPGISYKFYPVSIPVDGGEEDDG